VSSPTVDPLSKANSDAEARTVWLSYEMSLLQGNMKNPEAFKPTSVLLTSDGRVCVNYMSRTASARLCRGGQSLKSRERSGGRGSRVRWHANVRQARDAAVDDALGGRLIAVSPAEVPPTPPKKQPQAQHKVTRRRSSLVSVASRRDFTRTKAGNPFGTSSTRTERRTYVFRQVFPRGSSSYF